MHRELIGSILLSFFLVNCSADDSVDNPLVKTGLIGKWEINGLGINTISSLEALCCQTLILTDDANNKDSTGLFVSETEVTTKGVFTVNLSNNTILFTTENGNTDKFEFSLDSNDYLEVWYFEGDNRHWTGYEKVLE